MVSDLMTQRRYRRGDRVVLDGDTSCIGIVMMTGAVLNDDGTRVESVRVLWPIGTHAPHGFDDRPTWHRVEQVSPAPEQPCPLCKGEDYIEAAHGLVLCPRCLGAA